jgi:hypothetical protein
LIYGNAANTEIFMLLPFTLLLKTALEKAAEAKPFDFLTAAVWAAMALLYKPICLFGVIYIFGVWLWEFYQKNHTISQAIAYILLGGLSTTLLVCAPFLLDNGGKSLWECTVAYNLEYQSAGSSWKWWIDNVRGILKMLWPFFLILTGIFLSSYRKWIYYSAGILISLLSLKSAVYARYYIFFFPFFALLVGLACQNIYLFFSKKSFFTAIKPNTFYLFLSFSMLVLSLFPYRNVLTINSLDRFWKDYTGNPFIESVSMGERLASLTQEGNEVYVAGSEAQVLYYAKRKSISRFVIKYPLMLPTSKAEAYQAQEIALLNNKKPRFIVYSGVHASWLGSDFAPKAFFAYFNPLIEKEYRFAGGCYRNGKEKEWKWIDRLSNADDFAKCTLMLFERK